MEGIKQFTLRFDMENEAQVRAFEYLKAESAGQGISQNTFLLQMIAERMEGKETETISKDEWAERIAARVAEKLLKTVTIAAAGQGSIEAAESVQKQGMKSEGQSDGCVEVISEDAMDFLDCFG